MSIYWSLKTVPELAALSRKERDRLWRSIYLETFFHWPTWLALLFLIMLQGIGRYIGNWYGHPIIGSIVFNIVAYYSFFFPTQIHVGRPYLREKLATLSDR